MFFGAIVLCAGRHDVERVTTIPVELLFEWQEAVLGRPVRETDPVPRIYGCANCFSETAPDSVWRERLGLAPRPAEPWKAVRIDPDAIVQVDVIE